MVAATTVPPPLRPKGWGLLAVALRNRKSATMLGFGFSSGLPFALLIGTLNAWLGEVGVKLATIGVLSWIGLAYAFKFLWSPLVDRVPLPGLEALGRRKSWIALCQAGLVAGFVGLALTDPAHAIGAFAGFAAAAALASATQDVAIDAWRIDVADEAAPVELLSAIYQLGFRTASIVGGALALVLAARMSWASVYLLMAGLVVLVLLVVTLRAPDTPRPDPAALDQALDAPGELTPRGRALALAVVVASWAWAIVTIGWFMVSMLAGTPAGVPKPSVADFTKLTAPWIVVATVVVPLLVAAVTNRLKAHGRAVLAPPARPHGLPRHPGLDPGSSFSSPTPAAGPRLEAGATVKGGSVARSIGTAANHLYVALVSPLAELAARLGWGVLSVIGMILTYTLCYNIWASFALPFYLDLLHYTKDEVAFASKLFGIVMTMLGISLGAALFARIGRMPTILIGAVLPVLGNFVYADLAEGARGIDAVGGAIGLTRLFAAFGFDERMVRLLLAISAENVSTGLAGAAFVAYLSGIVSKRFTAVQYALLSSLTFLIGSLGRGIAGEAIDTYGYAPVFRWTAAAGAVAVVFVLVEWARTARVLRHARDERLSRAAPG